MDDIIAFAENLGAVVALRPAPGDGSPEITWGDTFFYYSPDGTVPATGQPFATIVTKDYPGDESSRLDRPDAFRVNIAVGKDELARWNAETPDDTDDTVMVHPVYGAMGWLAVVNPGHRTSAAVPDLLRTAHSLARARLERRTGTTPG